MNKILSGEKKFKVISDLKTNTLQITDGVKCYSLYSSYNPVEIAEKKIKTLNADKSKLVIIFGLGGGYEVKALLKNKESDCKVFVIEPISEIFNRVDKKLIKEAEDKNFKFIIGKTIYQTIDEIKDDFKNLYLKYPVIISNPAYEICFSEYLREIDLFIKQQFDIEKTVVLTKKMGENVFTNNIFENLLYFTEALDISELFGIFKGYPAVVVSAGPSLKKQLNILREIKNKALIVCVDTALRVLENNNIVPDIVVSIDFTPTNFNHFKNVNTYKYVYAFASIVFPECVKYHVKNGGKFFSILNDTHLKDWLSSYYPAIGNLAVGDSTSHAAFHLAQKMGCNKIALIGQDLAYTDNLTHCDGVSTQKKVLDDKDMLEVCGYYGGRVKTSLALFTILKHFEEKISDSGVEVFNCTEGGANIKGAINISFKDFLDKHALKENNFEGVIREKVNKKGFFDYEGFLNDLSYMYQRSCRIIKLSIRSLKIIDKMIDFLCIDNFENLSKFNEKLGNIYKEIISDHIIMGILNADISMSLFRINNLKNTNTKIIKLSMLEDIENDKLFFSDLLKAALNFRRCIINTKKFFSDKINKEKTTDAIIRVIGDINENRNSLSSF